MFSLLAPPLLLLLLATPVQNQVPTATRTDEASLIKDIRQAVLAYSSKIPNFECMATIKREEDVKGNGSWQLYDVIEARLVYLDNTEQYSVVSVNSKPSADRDIESLGGERAWGEFALHLPHIFHPRIQARLRWIGDDRVGDRLVHVITFSISKRHSTLEIGLPSPARPAYQGRIFIETNSRLPLRLELWLEKLPKRLGIRRLVRVIEYGYVDIAGSKHLLPTRATTETALKESGASRLEKVFHHYKRFAADSRVTFGEVIR